MNDGTNACQVNRLCEAVIKKKPSINTRRDLSRSDDNDLHLQEEFLPIMKTVIGFL